MQGGGFQLSEADPCMLYKEDEKGVCIIIIYIVDMLIISKEEAIITFFWEDSEKNPTDVLSKHWDFPSAWPLL